MRILALHGTPISSQNAFAVPFSSFISSLPETRPTPQLGAIRKACGKECEFVFLDGPHVLTLADVNFGNMDVQETQPEPTDPELIPRAWWRSDDAGTKYRGLEESLLYLRDHLLKEKYNGVFGFSQGATMAALLAAVLERPALAAQYNLLTDGQMPHPPFEFCVVAAGFIPRDPSLAGIFTEASVDGPAGLHTRSLHIIGATDILVTPERSQPLIDASTKARVEQHLGGHFVPATGPWRTFFKAYLNAKSDDEAAAVPSPSSTNSGTSTPVTSAL